MYEKVAAASSNSPFWNCDFPNSSHAFQMKGLYSRLPSHSMSFGVFRLDLVHSGRFLMLCRLMAFSAFSIARSKFCLPMSLPVLVPAGYSGSCSVKLSLCPFSFSNDPSMNAWLPLKYVLYRALKPWTLRERGVFLLVEHAQRKQDAIRTNVMYIVCFKRPYVLVIAYGT